MLYINDTEHQYKTYDEVVAAAVANGVAAKRVYIHLAALGVKGVPTRILGSDAVDYLPPVKFAVKGKKLVTKVEVCKNCKGLIIE